MRAFPGALPKTLARRASPTSPALTDEPPHPGIVVLQGLWGAHAVRAFPGALPKTLARRASPTSPALTDDPPRSSIAVRAFSGALPPTPDPPAPRSHSLCRPRRWVTSALALTATREASRKTARGRRRSPGTRRGLSRSEQHGSPRVGTWRSLVAHLNGVQGVASSNLAVPTTRNKRHSHPPGWLFSFREPQLRPLCAPWRGRPRPRARPMRTRACRPPALRTVESRRPDQQGRSPMSRPGGGSSCLVHIEPRIFEVSAGFSSRSQCRLQLRRVNRTSFPPAARSRRLRRQPQDRDGIAVLPTPFSILRRDCRSLGRRFHDIAPATTRATGSREPASLMTKRGVSHV